MDLREIGWDSMEWIDLDRERYLLMHQVTIDENLSFHTAASKVTFSEYDGVCDTHIRLYSTEIFMQFLAPKDASLSQENFSFIRTSTHCHVYV
jgi:hypothetical protein